MLVDEAHSFLLCGERGRGVAEQQGVLDQVDYFVLTFSKALGGVGGALITQCAAIIAGASRELGFAKTERQS